MGQLRRHTMVYISPPHLRLAVCAGPADHKGIADVPTVVAVGRSGRKVLDEILIQGP